MVTKTDSPTTSRALAARGSRRFSATVVAGAFGIAALVSSGCGGSRAPADDPAQQVAAANQRLNGTWTLVEFQPDVALEPMLAQLLGMQIGRLTAQFDGTRLSATGVGVQATRSYRVDSATGGQLHLTLFDESGVRYEVAAAFDADLLRFQSLTLPWTGRGVLKRAAPGYQ